MCTDQVRGSDRPRSLAKQYRAVGQPTQCRNKTDCLYRVVGWLPVGAIGRTALGSPKTVTDPVDAVESEFDTDFAILMASQPGETTLAVASFACSAPGLVGLGCRSGYARRGARGMDGAVLSVRGTYRSNGGQSPEHHGVAVSWRARLAAQIEFWVAAGSLAPAGAMESTFVHARLRRRIRGNKKKSHPP